MTATPTPAETPLSSATLRLAVVPTPQPPLSPEPVLRLVVPGAPVPRPRHRPGPRPREEGRDPEHRWSSRADLPDPARTGRQLFVLTLEGLAGLRPLVHVQGLTSVGVYAALVRGRRPRWCAGGTAPVLLGPVHVCEPVDGVAEVSAVARRSGRAHAVAARLEGMDGRWRCTALQVG
ncbi:Rv3235 family protein [Geodermatophilus sp. SYSU D00758]